MLRGDPVFISPVRVFGAEYQHDIGWPGKELLELLPDRTRNYWRFYEISSVFGTWGLGVLMLYLVLHGAFLAVGVPAIVAWAIWLCGNQLVLERSLIRRGTTIEWSDS